MSNSLFQGCTSLREIALPESVTVIGDNCFTDCTSLVSVTFGENLRQLGYSTYGGSFQNCTALETITLPESLEEIGSDCFSGCTALENISVGHRIATVGSHAFYQTAFLSNADNWENDALYLDDICISINNNHSSFISMKAGTRVIAAEAYYHASTDENLTTLLLPNTVEHIGQAAFFNNNALSVIRMSANIKTIALQAFQGCDLHTMYLPESTQSVSQFLGNAANDAFPNLQYILVESKDCVSNLSIPGCPSLKTLVVPYSDTNTAGEILNTGYSNSRSTAENLVVTGSTMSAQFLSGIDSQTKVFCEVPEGFFPFTGNNKIYYEGEWNLAVFWSNGILVQVTPYPLGGVLEVPSDSDMAAYALGDDTFAGWDIDGDAVADRLPVTLSSDLEAVAVWNHTHVSIVDPAVAPTCAENGLTEGSHCSTCGEVLIDQEIVPALGHDYVRGVCARCGKTLEQLANGCSGDLSWVLTEDGTLTFFGSGAMENYTSNSEMPWYSYLDQITSVVIEEGVTSIGDYAFKNSTALDNVVLPNTLTKIGESAFFGCTSLTGVDVPGSVTEIGWGAFGNCSRLEEIRFNGDAPAIREEAFSGVTATVYYPAGNETWTGDVMQDYGGTLTWVAQEQPVDNPFTDVQETDYYYDAVLWAYSNGITSGTSDTAFSPDNPCTRGQVVTFIWRAMGEPEPTITENPFADVKASEYYYEAVLWAYEQGIVAGKTETGFAPNDTVTRAQVVTFLWRMEGSPEPESTENPFKDVKETEYYYQAVLWAYENGITAGVTETLFKPEATCTRAQVVCFLYRDMGGDSEAAFYGVPT